MRKKLFLTTVIGALCAFCAGFASSNDNGHTNGAHQKNGIHWMSNYDQALVQAKKEDKPVLLFFTGSDWCGWCKKLDREVFSTSDFAAVAGNSFVFVELDFPMGGQQSPQLAKQNADLKQKYGISGFPTVILLNPNGTFLAETGYRPGGGREYGHYLLQLAGQ